MDRTFKPRHDGNTVEDFQKLARLHLAIGLPFFQLSDSAFGPSIDGTFEPCFGVNIRITVTPRVTYRSSKDGKVLNPDGETKGVTTNVVCSSASWSPQVAGMVAKVLTDVAATLALIEATFERTVFETVVERQPGLQPGEVLVLGGPPGRSKKRKS